MRKRNNVSSLNPRIKTVLHYVSVASSFLMLWSIIAILQGVTIGMIPHVWDFTVMRIPIVAVIFSLTSAAIVWRFARFESPYK